MVSPTFGITQLHITNTRQKGRITNIGPATESQRSVSVWVRSIIHDFWTESESKRELEHMHFLRGVRLVQSIKGNCPFRNEYLYPSDWAGQPKKFNCPKSITYRLRTGKSPLFPVCKKMILYLSYLWKDSFFSLVLLKLESSWTFRFACCENSKTLGHKEATFYAIFLRYYMHLALLLKCNI